MTRQAVTVMIVDDHPVVRAGIASMLQGHRDVEVIADTGDGEDAIRLAVLCDPDVVLCDLRLGTGIDGVDVTRRLRAGAPERPHVVILTTFDHDADIIRAVEAGASGYLLKDASDADIIEAITAAHVGDTVLSGTLVDRFVQASRTKTAALSERELEVLALLAKGHANKDIARDLFVSEATVKTHVQHILRKLHAENRTAAVAAARASGILT